MTQSQRPRVYVSGSITTQPGYEAICNNLVKAFDIGDELLKLGYAPFVPHYSHFWNLYHYNDYETWLDYDMAFVEGSHAVYRMPGESKGADAEVAHAIEHGIPVAYSIPELLAKVPPKGV